MPVAGKKDVHGDYGEFCYRGFRHSLCHGWSSGPAAWCIANVLGVKPIGVGCREFKIEPHLGDLEWAEGSYALPGGKRLEVKVRKGADGKPTVVVRAPEGVRIVKE
jgi:hypothetical protein